MSSLLLVLALAMSLGLPLAVRAAEADPSVEPMAAAARNLLATLDEEERGIALHPFAAEERTDWHFIPKLDRKGLAMKRMSPEQIHLTHALLNASLSRTGYAKTATIMSLEAVLRELEVRAGRTRAPEYRDPYLYHLTFFGEPSADRDWGWSIEGHHVSLNFTVVGGGAVATSPAFLGANPHVVAEGPRRGLRVLHQEEDRARELLASFDDGQRRQAILSPTAPPDIFTGAEPRVTPEEPQGIAAAVMSPEQLGLLRALIDTYVDNLPSDLAAKRRAQVEAAGKAIHFAWMGSEERGKAHYYRVQAPEFVIEYDNVQNDANHSHTVWRDFEGDFGRDLLAEHHRLQHRDGSSHP